MRRLLLFLLIATLVVVAGFLFFKATKEKVKQDFARPIPYPTITPTPLPPSSTGIVRATTETFSLFVPYWSLKEKINNTVSYDQFIYFGIAPNINSIDMKEQGAKSLDQFLSFVPQGKKKLLTLRMIEAQTNFAILKDSGKQLTVISQTIQIAKKNKFDGIVLDLEVSAIPFESLVTQITNFTSVFYKEAKNNNLEFAITMYGDVFYRIRPFDVKTLAKHTDRMMIMAYDFSKAKGNPGPNFPLYGEEEYGYDLEKMIADFSKVIPVNKITVIFGMFGYDWQVDKQGRTVSQAKALTLTEIQKKFIDSCAYRSCTFSRDSISLETEVHYKDLSGRYHIVWFEDMDSVAAKKEFLKSQGVSSFSYWSHSYF